MPVHQGIGMPMARDVMGYTFVVFLVLLPLVLVMVMLFGATLRHPL